MQAFFGELRRRNVLKVAAAYAALGWLAIETCSLLIELTGAPREMLTGVVFIVGLGFPIVLVISWLFEMTPNGMKRTQEVSPDEAIPYWSRRKYFALIVIATAVALAIFVFQHWHR